MSARDNELIAVYADESCLGNGQEGANPGGAAGVVEYMTPNTGVVVRRDYWISEAATTNNRMALRSVIEGFNLLSAKSNRFDVIFTSDSQYLVKGMTEWVHSWASRGWKRKGGAIENLDLWHHAVRAVRDHRVQWRWVRGHDGHPQNAYADHLATRAAARQDNSPGLAPSHFAEWLAIERAERRIKHTADPFPLRSDFLPARALPAPPGPAVSGPTVLFPP